MYLVTLVCVHACVCICGQKTACMFEVLLLEKSIVSVTYCSLIEFNCQKRRLLHQEIPSGKEIRKQSIDGTGASQGFRNVVLQ